jgi:hypothetical protein
MRVAAPLWDDSATQKPSPFPEPMNVSSAELTLRYREMPDEDLIAYCRSGTLVPTAQQIADAEARRRGLDVDPAGTDEPDDDGDGALPGDLVTIATFATVTEARVLEARLLTEGIGASVVDAHLFQAMQFLAAGRGDVRVQVPEAQVELSRQVLAAIRSGDYELDDGEVPEARAPSASPQADASGITAADVEAYTQHGYYARAFDAMLTRQRRWGGINVSVLIFGSLWFFYRRLPLVAFAYLAGVAALFLVFAWASAGDGGMSSQAVKNGLFASLAVNRIVAALVANNLYLRKVLAALRRLRSRGVGAAEWSAVVREQGGPSVLALGAAVLVPLLLLLILNA